MKINPYLNLEKVGDRMKYDYFPNNINLNKLQEDKISVEKLRNSLSAVRDCLKIVDVDKC